MSMSKTLYFLLKLDSAGNHPDTTENTNKHDVQIDTIKFGIPVYKGFITDNL